MCVFRVRSRTKVDGFMTRREIDIEPGNKGVNEVVAPAVKPEGGSES
jgi:hypothetical protein